MTQGTTPEACPTIPRGHIPYASAASKSVCCDITCSLRSLNVERYKNFDSQPAKQCVFAYDGPAYKGLQVR